MLKSTPLGIPLKVTASPPISTAMLQLLHHHATAKAPPLTVIPSFGQNTIFQVLLCRTISIHPPSNTRHKDMMQWMHTLPTMTVAMLTTPLALPALPPTCTNRGVYVTESMRTPRSSHCGERGRGEFSPSAASRGRRNEYSPSPSSRGRDEYTPSPNGRGRGEFSQNQVPPRLASSGGSASRGRRHHEDSKAQPTTPILM